MIFNKKSNFLTLFKGSFLSKIILAIGGIILAKIVGPTDYGTYNIFFSIYSILLVVNPLGLDHMIILLKNDGDAKNSFIHLLYLSLFVSLFTLLTYFLSYAIFENLYLYSPTIVVLSIISGLIMSWIGIFKNFFSRQNTFKVISNILIIDAFTTLLFQFILIYLKIDNPLIIGSFIGFLLTLMYCIWNVDWKKIKVDWQVFNVNKKNYEKLLSVTFLSNLLNTIGNNIMTILIAVFFLKENVGVFSLAVKLVSVPMMMISTSFATLYYPKASWYYHHEPTKLLSYTKKISNSNFLMVLGALFLLNIIGVPAFTYIFNKNWENLSIVVALVSFWFLFRSLVMPISDILVIIKKNKVSLLFNIFLIVINITSLLIGYFTEEFIYMIFFMSLFMGISYSMLYFHMIKSLKKI